MCSQYWGVDSCFLSVCSAPFQVKWLSGDFSGYCSCPSFVWLNDRKLFDWLKQTLQPEIMVTIVVAEEDRRGESGRRGSFGDRKTMVDHPLSAFSAVLPPLSLSIRGHWVDLVDHGLGNQDFDQVTSQIHLWFGGTFARMGEMHSKFCLWSPLRVSLL